MYKNRLFVGKAESVLSEIFPDECVDLTVTSPPYDELRDYKGYTFDFEVIAGELYRVTAQGGVVVWVVGDTTVKGSETLTSFKQALHFKEIGFNVHDTMIYEKNGFSYPSSNRYHQVFEYMFVLSKGKPKTFNPIVDRPNKYAGQFCWGKNTQRQKDGTLVEGHEREVMAEFGMRHNIWRINTGGNVSTSDKEAFKHPAIFPEALARDHILSWTNIGDFVLDPMCGSGTTNKMAVTLGRNTTGIDLSQEYLDIALSRIKKAKEVRNGGDQLRIL